MNRTKKDKVIELFADGWSTKEVAEHLGMDVATVAVYKSRNKGLILEKQNAARGLRPDGTPMPRKEAEPDEPTDDNDNDNDDNDDNAENGGEGSEQNMGEGRIKVGELLALMRNDEMAEIVFGASDRMNVEGGVNSVMLAAGFAREILNPTVLAKGAEEIACEAGIFRIYTEARKDVGV